MNDKSKYISNLSQEEKRKLLAQELRKKNAHSRLGYPLSSGQRALWFLYQLAPGSAAYNIMFAGRIKSALDIPSLQRSFQDLSQRHSSLRTVYKMRGGEPLQRVLEHQELHVQVVDASNWSWDQVQNCLSREADQPFDLERGPVFRVNLFKRSPTKYILLLAVHHIAVDFWSIDVMINELNELYNAHLSGIPASLPPLDFQYYDYIRWQEKMLSGAKGERLWKYWEQQLAGDLPLLDLPVDRPRPLIQTYRGDLCTFNLDDPLRQQLKMLANSEGATLFMMLLTAYKILLSRYSGQEVILVGCPMVSKIRTQLKRVVGYFINSVVLRSDLSDNPTFLSLLTRVREMVLTAVEHQDYPFPLLVQKLRPTRAPGRSPLFQVALFWDKSQLKEKHGISIHGVKKTRAHTNQGQLEIEPLFQGQRGAPFDLTLTIVEAGSQLTGWWQYSTDLFAASTIDRLSGHFLALLKGIVANPGQSIRDLPLLGESERRQLLVEWNDTREDYPQQCCLHELFAACAQRMPDNTAVVFEDQYLAYRLLNQRADQLAHYLQTMGVGTEIPVAICMERSLDMVIALLGILKAGGTYVPLDPLYPGERLNFMLNDTGTPVLLTQQRWLEKTGKHKAKVICLDIDKEKITCRSITSPTGKTTADNLVYTIYTSGSTGRPKGVQILHGAVVNLLSSMRKQPGLTQRHLLLSVTTLCFDIAVLEIFLPLTTGAAVLLVSSKTAANGKELLKKLINSHANVMQATPSTWRLLLEAGWQGSSQLKILCGGEPLPRELAEKLLQRCSSLWNLYGPTETTIWSTVFQVKPGNGPVSIGRPIANTRIYILDTNLQPVPVGVAGELYIGGVGLARGYLNHPGLTAENFIPDPFVSESYNHLYKTGDLACFCRDGSIEFLGRIDHQVKINGFRIELKEIEIVLGQHPAVREILVTARDEINNFPDKRLVAYFIPHDKPGPTVNELRRFLKKKLPDYMVPSAFISLEIFPLAVSGKVDLKALPAPGATRPKLQEAYEAPRTRVEKLLARIWTRVLGIDKVGIQDNFFDLGGASSQSVQIVNHANKAGLQLTPQLIFQYQTIAQLAAVCGTPLQNAESSITVDEPDSQLSPQLVPDPSMESTSGINRYNTIIESLGTYLPQKAVSTKTILKGCKNKILFPLERTTGIRSRRMAGETEFSIDLAGKAIEECLSYSRYKPGDIDMMICCNISRFDAPLRFTFEPGTAVRLKKHFGFDNAIVFDITNACAGMWTGISIIDTFLNLGIIGCGMVVSGEYITKLTQTAQKEIEGFMDQRLACLTLGDAGAALILERAPDNKTGLAKIGMYTVGRYSHYCTAKPTDKAHGGVIMLTESINLSAASLKHAIKHTEHVRKQVGWSPEAFNHLIMHQVSKTSLEDSMRNINRFYKKNICNRGNVVNNLAERGNTASTSHFVALKDSILKNRIKPGDKILFSITGSGITIGSAFYTMDDLPERLQRKEVSTRQPGKMQPLTFPRARIESVGTIAGEKKVKRDSLELSKIAAEECFKKSSYHRKDIDLLIYTGVYRKDFLCEPAIATLLAGELNINADIKSPDQKKTLAFDVFNGGLGFLNACFAAIPMLRAQKLKNAMIITSEIENNARIFPGKQLGLEETASALILEQTSKDNGNPGFGHFHFDYFTDYLEAFTSHATWKNGKAYLDFNKDPNIYDYYITCIPGVVHQFLSNQDLDISQISVILPPQISSSFISKLSKQMNVPKEKFVDMARDGKDLFTSSMLYTFQYAREHQLVAEGDIGLIINIGSGIQVGCAVYYF